jgi:Protein of unknown function (DUF4240)
MSHKPQKDSLTEAEFWTLIALLDWSKLGNDDAIIAPVVQALANKSFRYIIDFADILSHKLFLLDSEIYLSYDDNTTLDIDFVANRFLYTRCCVVANGLTFFNHIRRHPIEMPHSLNFAALLRIPNEAFKKQTGKTLDHVWAYPIETFSNTLGWTEFNMTNKHV